MKCRLACYKISTKSPLFQSKNFIRTHMSKICSQFYQGKDISFQQNTHKFNSPRLQNTSFTNPWHPAPIADGFIPALDITVSQLAHFILVDLCVSKLRSNIITETPNLGTWDNSAAFLICSSWLMGKRAKRRPNLRWRWQVMT
jgi:hypothetical protein